MSAPTKRLSHETLPAGCEAARALPIVRRVIRDLKKAGYFPVRVDDGGDLPLETPTEAAMLDAIFAVDEATAWFVGGSPARSRFLYLILCNGEDVVSDLSAGSRRFSAVVNAAIDAAQRGAEA